MMDFKEICRGCQAYKEIDNYKEGSRCVLGIPDEYKPECVCKYCLVKVTCKKVCSELETIRKRIFNERWKKQSKYHVKHV